MFTPQEIQDKTFVKAIFGGYDMTSVDEFLEPMSADYIALYKENAVLKSKMKILVEKLEEYRAQEDTMKKAMVATTDATEKLKAETERKCAQMLTQAENAARQKTSEAAQQIAAEEERVERAKQAAQNFIEIVEKEVSRHIDLLQGLKTMNLAPRPVKPQPYDFERAQHAAEPSGEPEDPRQIADEIDSNLEKVIGPDPDASPAPASVPAPAPASAPQATLRFTDLQFGRNYDPNRG